MLWPGTGFDSIYANIKENALRSIFSLILYQFSRSNNPSNWIMRIKLNYDSHVEARLWGLISDNWSKLMWLKPLFSGLQCSFGTSLMIVKPSILVMFWQACSKGTVFSSWFILCKATVIWIGPVICCEIEQDSSLLTYYHVNLLPEDSELMVSGDTDEDTEVVISKTDKQLFTARWRIFKIL